MYKDRLQQLGAVGEGRVHSSRLKDRLLSALPDLQAHYEGNNIILSFMKILVLHLGRLVTLMMTQCTWYVPHK